jgi:hypothetical protein
MGYRVALGAVVGLHFAYLVFVPIGGFAALRWRRLIWPHVLAVAWGLAIIAVPGLACPLTAAEAWARRGAGMPQLSGGFVDEYVKGVLYPSRFTTVVQVVIAACVVLSWVLVYRRMHRKADRTKPSRAV